MRPSVIAPPQRVHRCLHGHPRPRSRLWSTASAAQRPPVPATARPSCGQTFDGTRARPRLSLSAAAPRGGGRPGFSVSSPPQRRRALGSRAGLADPLSAGFRLLPGRRSRPCGPTRRRAGGRRQWSAGTRGAPWSAADDGRGYGRSTNAIANWISMRAEGGRSGRRRRDPALTGDSSARRRSLSSRAGRAARFCRAATSAAANSACVILGRPTLSLLTCTGPRSLRHL